MFIERGRMSVSVITRPSHCHGVHLNNVTNKDFDAEPRHSSVAAWPEDFWGGIDTKIWGWMYTPNRNVNQALSAAAVGKTLLKRGGYARTVPLARATQYIGADKMYIRILAMTTQRTPASRSHALRHPDELITRGFYGVPYGLAPSGTPGSSASARVSRGP